MQISENGLNLIKRFEGLRLNAYKCPAGIPTIGYGHTKGVKMGQTITAQQAEIFLLEDTKAVQTALNNAGFVLNQNQYDALCSFFYNVGTGRIKDFKSQILANPKDTAIITRIKKYIYANKKVLAGLVTRRELETQLYQS